MALFVKSFFPFDPNANICLYSLMKTFSERLKHARERAGLTQQELAALIGTSQSTYHPWESGKRGKEVEPPFQTLVNLSDILGVSIDWLIRGDGGYGQIALDEKDSRMLAKYRIARKVGADSKIDTLAAVVVNEARQNYGGDTKGKESRVAHHKRRAS